MATASDHIADFRAFIKDLCDTDPGPIVADGRWHRFRIADTRHKSSNPGAYLLHADERPVGLFMDWRRKERHRWRPDKGAEPVDREAWRQQAAETSARRAAGYEAATKAALRFFQSDCTKINGASHPYLETKRIAPHGARQGPGRPFGLGDVSCVVIPIRGTSNQALTLQAIAADGARRFWPKSTTEGGHTLIGSEKAEGPVILCEGYATGASIHEATGCLVLVCFSASNMVRISRWAGHRFPERSFVVAGDDDWHLPLKPKPQPNEGREAALTAARNLGARVVFPDMQGLVTDGGDDFNDQAREYGLDDIRTTLFPPEPERAPVPLAIISPADWHGQVAPKRDWRLADFIPNGQATLFTGAGAVGKSLATQQMSTCIAMGLPFLGVQTQPGNALYVTCEDDPNELHRRQDAICRHLGIALSATLNRLFLLSWQGEIGNELATFDIDGTVKVTQRYHDLVATCQALSIRHLTLDNTAHLFAGNENDRHQVAAFINLCNRLARDIGGSVVIVGHPNKAGDSYSGSTAWENQVRSRIFMETPADDAGVVTDPDLRVMRNEKANYARRGSEVRFLWHQGAFVLDSQIEDGDREKLASSKAQQREDGLFLRLLDQLTREKRHVSHFPTTGNYAPKVMAGMTEARGMSKPLFHAAMERLLLAEEVEANQPLWLGKDRHPVLGLSRRRPVK